MREALACVLCWQACYVCASFAFLFLPPPARALFSAALFVRFTHAYGDAGVPPAQLRAPRLFTRCHVDVVFIERIVPLAMPVYIEAPLLP